MHPAIAVWVWSMTMSRIWEATLMGEEYRPVDDLTPLNAAPAPVMANRNLHTDLAIQLLPEILLDRLVYLHWTERDAQLRV